MSVTGVLVVLLIFVAFFGLVKIDLAHQKRRIESPEVKDRSIEEVLREMKEKRRADEVKTAQKWQNEFKILEWRGLTPQEQHSRHLQYIEEARKYRRPLQEQSKDTPWFPSREMLLESGADCETVRTFTGEIVVSLYSF